MTNAVRIIICGNDHFAEQFLSHFLVLYAVENKKQRHNEIRFTGDYNLAVELQA